MSLPTLSLTTTRPRDVQIAAIGNDTIVLRSRTWDRLKFEVEYARQRGTTANSYVIQAEKSAVIDPPGESFTQIYLQHLRQHLNLSELNYVIVGHVNPNRITTFKVLLDEVPQAKLICSRPAANALKATFPSWESRIEVVRSEDTLDLGWGHRLQFATVPTPRWADALCTYDPQTRILYTDKFFGVHVCGDAIWDEDWKQLDEDRLYYFDCLYATQAKQVDAALDKLTAFGAKYYAPNHGPLVRYSLSRLTYDYRDWCQQQKTKELRVALLYASAYGNTAALASAIAQGLLQGGVAVESINCELADPSDITRAVEACDGFIIGSPTLGGHAPVQIQTALGIILSAATKTKLAGVFGSYGWSGEAIDLIESKLQDANYRFGFNPIRVRFSPTSTILQECEDAGAEFAQKLKKMKKMQAPRQGLSEAQADRTEQAVGRIIGSLCVVTTRRGETHHGVLTSWVTQATFNPPGLAIAIAEDQNAELMIHPGDRFVLNILQEGQNLRRNFSYLSIPGDNPFTGLVARESDNGCLILDEALAYLQCTVQNRMPCGDRWLVYAIIDRGEVLQSEGVTAIVHRKSASY